MVAQFLGNLKMCKYTNLFFMYLMSRVCISFHTEEIKFIWYCVLCISFTVRHSNKFKVCTISIDRTMCSTKDKENDISMENLMYN